jgi:hypothetical protein
MPPLRNLWRFYPERKGLCTGVVLAFFGVSAVIFNIISNNIINPDKLEPDKNTKFYPVEVGRNVPTYFFYCFVITIIAGILSVFLVFTYEEDKVDDFIEQRDSVNKIEKN